jgi:hypothetical protein
MLKDDWPNGSPVSVTQIVCKGFLDVKCVWMQPVLTFDIALSGVDVRRFVPLVEVKEQSPPANVQDSWHSCSECA